MAATRQVPLPRPRPAAIANGKLTPPAAHNAPQAQKRPPEPAPGLSAFAQANTGMHALFATRAKFRPMARPVAGPFSVAPTTATSAADVALVRQVIDAARKGKETDADTAANAITDPVARKLAEWVILRSDNTNPEIPALCRIPERQSELAAFAAVPPARRERAVERQARRRRGPGILRQEAADHRQGPLRARARPARARRSRRRAGAGAAGLAQRRMQRRHGKTRARDFQRHDHARRREVAHAAAPLRRRRRGGPARSRTARRQRSADRESVGGGQRQAEQCQGLARQRARPLRATKPAIFSRACSCCAKTTSWRKPAS